LMSMQSIPEGNCRKTFSLTNTTHKVNTILSINQLSKAYGPIQALKGVSFDVPEGSVFGILGPNGSGKTTLLGIILDVLNADAGNYQWFGGMPNDIARRQCGSLLETPNFYHYLSAMDNLRIAAAIKQRGDDDRLRVLEQVGLLQRKDSAFQTYSLGMKQRLAIASTLLGNPKVLVFDEPTNGLDPAGIAEIRELILKLNREGFTIIMASHLLDEVEKVCTHVAILKKGELLVNGPVNEVLRSEDQIEVAADNLQVLQDVLRTMPGITQMRPIVGGLLLSCERTVDPTQSLETKFIELTNQ
jgi:ABC-type multidrug transport system ATPase subunit